MRWEYFVLHDFDSSGCATFSYVLAASDVPRLMQHSTMQPEDVLYDKCRLVHKSASESKGKSKKRDGD